MSTDRPHILEAVKRQVRKRCGFGCVVCGLPLYEYEHMTPYSEVKAHDPSNITLLCDRHHSEKTRGLLPEEAVRRADAQPYNLALGVTSPYRLHFEGDHCEIAVGSNVFGTSPGGPSERYCIALNVDMEPLVAFTFEDGNLLLTLRLFDETNRTLLDIQRNELRHRADNWDVEWSGSRILVRTASKRVHLDLALKPPNRIEITRGRLLCNGVEFWIRPDYIVCTNNGTSWFGCGFQDCSIGIHVGGNEPPLPSAIWMPSASRYLGDAREAVRRANAVARERRQGAAARDVSPPGAEND